MQATYLVRHEVPPLYEQVAERIANIIDPKRILEPEREVQSSIDCVTGRAYEWYLNRFWTVTENKSHDTLHTVSTKMTICSLKSKNFNFLNKKINFVVDLRKKLRYITKGGTLKW